jgi:rabenosyn-5
MVFDKRDFEDQLLRKTVDQKAYETLVQFETSIRLMLPKFQKLLVMLQDPEKPPSHHEIAEASRIRKRLLESFQQYNSAARRILSLPTHSETQKSLQREIYNQAVSFLQIHMLPLRTLPKVLKHATPYGHRPHHTNGSSSTITEGKGALASIKFRDGDETSQISSSSAVSVLESEEKVLRERLMVLEEQRYLVGEMMADANKRRMYEESKALQNNKDDLTSEIDRINGQLGQLDFEGAYRGLN